MDASVPIATRQTDADAPCARPEQGHTSASWITKRIVLCARRFDGVEVMYAVGGALYQASVFALADLHASPGGEPRARLRIVLRGAGREFRLEHCGEAAIYRDALLELRNQMPY